MRLCEKAVKTLCLPLILSGCRLESSQEVIANSVNPFVDCDQSGWKVSCGHMYLAFNASDICAT